MKWYLILILLLTTITIALFFVEPQGEGCSCSGISFGACLGSVRCPDTGIDCVPLTCENKLDLLGEPDTSKQSSLTYTLLIIDASKSMEGEVLDATKRASEAFIQEITPKEYIAIIEFNEQATKLTDFTNDKIDLYSSIELINPRGRTRYLEPFTLANEMFASVPEDARKYILFLSDGAPEDEEEDFLEQIDLLEDKRVNKFAIAFADKSNEEIMKEIASTDENLFLVSSATDMEEKFKEAFRSILEEGDIFLQRTTTQSQFRSQERIDLELYSAHNEKNILRNSSYCELDMTTYIEAQQEGKFSRILGSITGSLLGFPLNDLSAGTYDVVAHTRIFLDECTLRTTQPLGSIDIVAEDDCNISCEDITFAMTKGKNSTYASDRARTSWIILVDKSSSMNQGEHLLKAKQDIEIFLELMPASDSVIIGSFDNKVDLLSDFSSPREFLNTDFEVVVPRASTSLVAAISQAQRLEAQAPSGKVHTLIFSDGEYGIQNNVELNRSLTQLQGCLSTINYGTHLLTENESSYALLQEQRNCGVDIITRPQRSELQDMLESNLSTEPQLIIQLQQQILGNTSEYLAKTISSFTGVVPYAENEQCQISPRITVRYEDGREVVGNQFITEINEPFTIQAGFENTQCSFALEETITFAAEEQRSELLSIVAVVALVLAINMLVFIYVLSRKLKKLTRIK